jgi:predicted RNA-binding protein with RPS1 domain
VYVQKSVAAYGAFVDIGSTTDGLVHISQLSHGYVKDVNDFISPGQKINAVLLKIEGDNKLSLSIKAANPGKPPFVTILFSTLLEIPASQLLLC